MKVKNLTLTKVLPWLLLVAGLIGLGCALVLSLDEVKLLKNPAFEPSCNINPVIACGSVMKSAQAHAFGFPNPFLGLIAYTAVAVTGGTLLAGAKFKRWFWLAFNAGLLFAVGFVHWLFYQTVYQIHALCPYCMGVWVVTITSFWYVLLYNLGQGNINPPGKAGQVMANFVRKHHLDILILWFLIIFALILKHFWYYYGRSF